MRPIPALTAAGTLLYFKTLFFGWTYLDDNVLVINNIAFLSDLSNIFQAFRQEVFHIAHCSAAYYRPVLTVSFMLDAFLGGQNPFIYHFTNIAVHIAASCLVFLFLKRIGYEKLPAFFFSLIFTVHPVLTQAVAWIPGRNDSLMALFGLSAFIFFLDFLKSGSIGHYCAHLLFLGLAFFTKETSLIIPAMCILYYALNLEPRTAYINIKKKNIIKCNICLIAGWIAVYCLWISLRMTALVNPIAMTIQDMVKSMAMNAPAIIQFIGKILFPFDLSVLPLMQDTGFGYGIAALILIGAALFFSKHTRYGLLAFGAAWFIFFLLPSFIRPNLSVNADFIEHRVYMPIIGFFIILLETDVIKRMDFKSKRGLAVCAAIIGFLAAITFFHSYNFKDRMSFWMNAALKSPHSPLAHRNLGAMYYLDGRIDKAEAEYKESLELNSLEPMAHNNLGLIYASRGDFHKAEEEYKKELAINPFYDDAHFNMGLLYYKMGEFEKAKYLWKKTLLVNPNYVDASNALKALDN